MSTKTIGSFVLMFLCVVPLYAQNNDLTQLTSLQNTDGEYRLGAGDLVEISVFGVEKFRHTLRISASGMIKLPLIDPIMATGLTARELEERVTSALKDDVIRNPQVAVFVREYRSQPVFVLGAVKSPGQYQITHQLRLIDVLSMAGGVLPTAVDSAKIQRAASEPGAANSPEDSSATDEIINIDLEKLLVMGDLSLNVPIRGGDVIHIQERQNKVFYVVGEVNRAGAFPLPPKQEVRVSQAVASAGGPMKTAKMGNGVLVRYTENGQRQEFPISLSDILKGKREDIVVRADDVIFVPGSNFKSIGYGLLAATPNSLVNVPYALAYR